MYMQSWQIEPRCVGQQQNYKVVIRYWPLVSRCHLSDLITLLMYTRTEKTGERLPQKFSEAGELVDRTDRRNALKAAGPVGAEKLHSVTAR
jgi:hypothetical protein